MKPTGELKAHTYVPLEAIFTTQTMDDSMDNIVPAYIELNDPAEPFVFAGLLYDRLSATSPRVITITTVDSEFDVSPEDYNKYWRVWFRKPTQKQRKTNKWD